MIKDTLEEFDTVIYLTIRVLLFSLYTAQTAFADRSWVIP